MIRGLYTAASGMLAGERQQDVISNNLANINTAGYKKEDSIMRSFPEMLLYSLNDHTGGGPQGITAGMPNVGKIGTGAFLEEVLPRFSPGIMKQTSNKYGFAIQDADILVDPNDPAKGLKDEKSFFFVDDGKGGSLVSRDGDFHVDGEGYLQNSAGYYLQAADDQGKPVPNSRVHWNEQTGQPETGILNNGQFTTDPALKLLTNVTNTNKLESFGNNAYKIDPQYLGAGQGELQAGFIEGSNVDATAAMTDMISVMRLYEANQRVIRTLDSSLDKAVNSLGRL